MSPNTKLYSLHHKTYLFISSSSLLDDTRLSPDFLLNFRCKESTARVVVWREFSIPNSYTLEMSLGGGDFGGEDPSACVHYSVDDYMRMGHAFCEGIIDMYDPR